MLKNKRKTVGLRLSEKSNEIVKNLSEKHNCFNSDIINYILENMDNDLFENINLFTHKNFVNEFIELTKKYKG